MTETHPGSSVAGPGRLAYHVRPLRQWSGEKGLTQQELAHRTGISSRSLRSLETTPTVTRSVENLLRLSISLDTTVEDLFDPSVLTGLRRQLGAETSLHFKDNYHPEIAACYRSPYLVVAVMNAGDAIEVQRSRVVAAHEIPRVLRRLMIEYGCQTLIVEPNSHLFRIAKTLQCRVHTVAMRTAKAALVPSAKRVTNHQLCQQLVNRCPKLRRLVKIFPATGRIAMTERWRVVQLLPVALGIAANRLKLYERVPERG